MRELLSWARSSLLCWPVIFLVTVLLEPVSLLAMRLDSTGRAQHAVVRWWSRIVLKLVGPVVASRLDRIDPTRPRVYVANHLSALDIPLLYRCLPFPFRILAHRLVFKVPVIGWYLRRAGTLEIAPESVALTRRALREAVSTLRRGMPIVVFPEGERSPTGQMLSFRRGAFYIAMQAQADVVPLAILGTYEALPIGSAHLRRRALRLVVGDPIPVTEFTRKDLGALAARTQAEVVELCRSAAAIPH